MNSIELFRNYNDGNVDINGLNGESKEKNQEKVPLVWLESGVSWVLI